MRRDNHHTNTIVQIPGDAVPHTSIAAHILPYQDPIPVSIAFGLTNHSIVPSLTAHRHDQLKNFISTVEEDIIYYASEHDIYALHLSTRKRESIASLPWKPQCLDARYGWICVGGPANGHCAFICIGGKESSSGRGNAFRHEAEVDALLPLDLDPDSRMLAHSYFQRLRSTSSPSRSKPEVQIHELGPNTMNSIMNSVSIHRLQSGQSGQYEEIVCVMTCVPRIIRLFREYGLTVLRNNDFTVRIFSLSRSRLLSTLQFSIRMNHASISPDGQLLVAVGDQPKAFFCRRVPSTSSSIEDDSHTWQQIAETSLAPAVPGDACFTTAFSPSGHVCAVAQQSGILTLFDTSLIQEDMEDDDAVIEILRSSRVNLPRDYVGAIRSMSFSPAPWDLLAWAEDRGRVCVTDLRNACRSRQTLNLDLDSPSLNRASVTDSEDAHSTTSEQRQLEIERRFLQRHREALNAQNDLANVSHVADYIELSAARRRLQRDTAQSGEFNDLTESERQMLESIRTHRLQESDHSNSGHDSQRPFSVNYLLDHSDPSDAQSMQIPPLSSNPALRSAELATWNTTRDIMRRSHLDRSRTADRGTYQPRRRGSVVISSSSNPSRQSSSSHPSSLAPIGSSVPTLSASPSRLASVVANAENADWDAPAYESSEAWQTVQDAMGTAPLHAPSDSESDQQQRRQGREERSRDPATTGAMLRLLQQQQQQLQQQQQQQMARLERHRTSQVQRSRHVQALNRAMAGERGYETTDMDMSGRITETSARREHGVRTMGIGWRHDGRSL